MLYAAFGGAVGLVDVYTTCRATELSGCIADIRGRATYGVVEDENTVGASTVKKRSI
jgi:hypothetical protein